jgi:(2Fe-2S) ferredoxin
MVQINDYYYENLDVERLDRIIDAHATKGSKAAAAEFATHARFGAPRAKGSTVTSAPPPPSREAVRLASQPPPAAKSSRVGEGET